MMGDNHGLRPAAVVETASCPTNNLGFKSYRAVAGHRLEGDSVYHF